MSGRTPAVLLVLTLGCQAVGERREASWESIDVHVHVFSPSRPYLELLDRRRLRVLNIAVVDKHDRGFEQVEPQHRLIRGLVTRRPDRVAWCSTFEPEGWESEGFADRVLRDLRETFTQGAVAVKIYKSIGMELRAKDGRFLMADDPVFDPIYRELARSGVTLLAHLAEPPDCWEPLQPGSMNYSYYKATPAWHMHRHPDRPKKRELLEARDRLLSRHPTLRMIGVHLGSMEEDVEDIARRFDRHPNFAVDTGGRVGYLMMQPRDKVRSFLLKYADRVLYGSDVCFMPWDDEGKVLERMERMYERDWKYFATEETIDFRGTPVRGLGLPPAVLKRILCDNAFRWIPGLKGVWCAR